MRFLQKTNTMKFKTPNKKWTLVWIMVALIFVLAVFPVPAQKPITYIDRESGQVKIEKVYGEKSSIGCIIIRSEKQVCGSSQNEKS